MSAPVGPVYLDVNVVRTIIARRGDLEGWWPSGVTHNHMSGHILVVDFTGNCIRVFSDNPPYTYITQYGRRGQGEGEYMWPNGITCDSEGRVIVADSGNRRLQVLTHTGQYLGQVTGIMCRPECVCVDGEDNMYVASDDIDRDNIRVYNPQGEPLPTIRRRGQGNITISGEHLYEVGHSNNHPHIRIHSLTDRISVKSVPLPQQIPNIIFCGIHITACGDGRLLITVQGWRAGSGAPVIDRVHSYIYILDDVGHNLTPRPYRYEGRVEAKCTLLYDNTLVVAEAEGRLALVTLPGLDPPLQPTHSVRVTSLQNLCLYKIRSIIRRKQDVCKLREWVVPGLISKLMELYP